MNRGVAWLCTVLAAAAPSVAAHHSGAGVDRTRTVTVTGTVKEFRWTNPHSWIDLDVPNDKGGSDIWSIEMNPPAYLVRAGWKASTIKPGDRVTVSLRPMRNGDPGGIFVSVTLADGRVLGDRAASGAAPAASPPAAPTP